MTPPYQHTLRSNNSSLTRLKPIELQEIFSGYVFDWLRDSIPKLEGMVTEALKHDKKAPLSDTVMHSSSVTDVFVALNQAFTFIVGLKMNNGFLLSQLVEVWCCYGDKCDLWLNC